MTPAVPASTFTTRQQDALDAAFELFVNVKSYGAIGDAATDDTAALNTAFAAGNRVFIPAGTYKFTSALTIPDYTMVEGAGSGASVLSGNFGTGTAITVGVDSMLKSLKVGHSVTRTAGFSVILSGNRSSVIDCELTGYFLGISMAGASSGSLLVGGRIEGCQMYTPATGSGSAAIIVNNYSSCRISDCIITGSSGTQPDFGIKVKHGDTIFLSNINTTLHGVALFSSPGTGETCFSVEAVNCAFDSANAASSSSVQLVPSSGGFIKNHKYSNCWFGFSTSQSGCIINPTGTGVVDGVSFNNCEFNNNGDCGLRVNGANVQNFSVVGGWSTGNGDAGIYITGTSSDFIITGHTSGNVAGRGVNNRGIRVSAEASDHYIITNNLVRGNTTAQITDGGTGGNKVVANNVLA